MLALALRLCELREMNGITQFELGDILGVSDKIVSKWETGEYVPSVEELLGLSDLYNVSMEYFINCINSERGDRKYHDVMLKRNIMIKDIMIYIFLSSSNFILLFLYFITFNIFLLFAFILCFLAICLLLINNKF